ncbi:MAG: hypothetical protein IJX44_00725 [Bacteroidaceae bacterium]|nr:hypothetical protein [Bacteroidaceae bacterium]
MIEWNDEISDEMLAAYIDGNATAEEAFRIESTIASDGTLQECLDIANDSISINQNSDCMDVWQGDYGFWEMGIPPIFSIEESDNSAFNMFGNERDYISNDYDFQAMDDFDDFIETGNECDMDLTHYISDMEDTMIDFNDVDLE